MSSPAEMIVGYNEFRPVVPPAPPPDASEYTLHRALRILRDGVRADDCLPITDEVRRVVAGEEAYFTARLGGTPPAASYMRGILVDQILADQMPDQHVAYLDDEKGVVVLAVGLDDISVLLRSPDRPPEDGLVLTYVDAPGTISALGLK